MCEYVKLKYVDKVNIYWDSQARRSTTRYSRLHSITEQVSIDEFVDSLLEESVRLGGIHRTGLAAATRGEVIVHPFVIVVVVVDAVVRLHIHDTRAVSTSKEGRKNRYCSFMWHHSSCCGGDDQHGSFPTDCRGGLETYPWRSCFMSFLLMAKRSQRRNPDIRVRISPSATKFNDDDDDDDDEQSGGTASVGIGTTGVGNVVIGNDDDDGGR